MKIELNGAWSLSSKRYTNIPANVPGTVLGALLANKRIEDPYFRDNEGKARETLQDDYVFSRSFFLPQGALESSNYICFDGIDTEAKIYVNDVEVAQSHDMNIRQRVLLNNELLRANNEIRVEIESPYRYIENYPNPKGLFMTFGVTESKSPCMRKSNCMFGWDWGPNLADMGIFRSIYIESTKLGFLKNHRVETFFNEDGSAELEIATSCEKKGEGMISIELSYPGEGSLSKSSQTLSEANQFHFHIQNPHRWYPNGFGDPSLYDLLIRVEGQGETKEYHYHIGLREVEIRDEKDEIGRNFAVYINKQRVFLKGSNYVPMDSLLGNVSEEKTNRLLKLCQDFNHNCIRVWGGGYYPDDYFYELCDRYGLLVFQDLMFACASYDVEDAFFRELIIEETKQALERIRNHPSLFLLSGNNEIEDGVRGHGQLAAIRYLQMTYEILAPIVQKETSLYFLPSSPTSGEPLFSMPQDMDYLDSHFWPELSSADSILEYGRIEPRMLSEFGFQSYPTMQTLKKYFLPSDLEEGNPILLSHQKKARFEESISLCLKARFKEPKDFQSMVYLSSLLQGEVIQDCVENLRRNEYRCNGALYWQLNDVWPAIGWSSIDYEMRPKALHYASKRFFAPEIISSYRENGKINVVVSNQTSKERHYKIVYRLIDFSGNLIEKKEMETTASPYVNVTPIAMSSPFKDGEKNKIAVFDLYDETGSLISQRESLPSFDKDLDYLKPTFSLKKINDTTLEIQSDVFARGVFIDYEDSEMILSDNYFDLLPGEAKRITSSKKLPPLSSFEIMSVYGAEK